MKEQEFWGFLHNVLVLLEQETCSFVIPDKHFPSR